MIAQEVTAWNTAMEMTKEGLRPPIVHAATGLCRNRLRSLYRAVHGKGAVQGRVSEYAYNRLKTKNQVIEATIYYQIYYGLGGKEIFRILDPVLFLKAYKAYKGYSPDCIDVTTAWFVARDLRENLLTPRRCQVCGREYLYVPRSEQMSRCPLCAG